MSAEDDTLLLRRYRLPRDADISGQGDPNRQLPQPPPLNRLVKSVYDARPSFSREFLLTQVQTVTGGQRFIFAVPTGYVGVLRRFRTWFSVDAFTAQPNWWAQILLNGVPIPDVTASDASAVPYAGTVKVLEGIPLQYNAGNDGSAHVVIDQNGVWQDFYLEVPPGGSMGLRVLAPGGDGSASPVQAFVQVEGQFLRADNVPTELQVASPPQLTPVVFVPPRAPASPLAAPPPAQSSSPISTAAPPTPAQTSAAGFVLRDTPSSRLTLPRMPRGPTFKR